MSKIIRGDLVDVLMLIIFMVSLWKNPHLWEIHLVLGYLIFRFLLLMDMLGKLMIGLTKEQ